MKTTAILGVLLLVLLTSCQKGKVAEEYLINADQIGNLTKDTPLNRLESIFPKDSIVRNTKGGSFSNGSEISVYKKGGQEILRIRPKKEDNPSSKAGRVQVMDSLYSTAEGLHVGGTFDVITQNYKISKIENSLRHVLIFLDDLNIYVDIDKKYVLKPNDIGVKIKKNQIKKKAVIGRLWVNWE